MIQNRAKRAPLAVLAAAAVLGSLTACSGDGAGPSGGDSNIVQGTGEITHVPVGERDQAPDLSGETLEGEPLSLADYRGDVVVINVWGSWCAPCRAEAPGLVAVAEDTADEGVSFVGINTRDLDTANALAFERTFDVEYPSLFDPSGRLLTRFPSGTLNPQAIPTTVIIDREGRIAARALKPLAEEELREALEPVLSESATDEK